MILGKHKHVFILRYCQENCTSTSHLVLLLIQVQIEALHLTTCPIRSNEIVQVDIGYEISPVTREKFVVVQRAGKSVILSLGRQSNSVSSSLVSLYRSLTS